jgi:hypothetical protein
MAEWVFRTGGMKLRNGASHKLDCDPGRRFEVTSLPRSDNVRIHSRDLTNTVNRVLQAGETVGIARRMTLSCYSTAQLRIVEFETSQGKVCG